MLVKANKIANPVKKYLLINPIIPFYYTISFFFHQIIVNVYNIINCNSIIINTKIINITINPTQNGLFRAAHGWGRPPSLKSATYILQRGSVIPYPRKIQKIYE